MHRFLISIVAGIVSLLAFAQEQRPQVTFTTDLGDIVVELYNETPIHRDNFLKQVRNHTYDGVLFHRVINQFMVQTGDPLSKDAKPGELLGNGTEKKKDWLEAEFRIPTFFHQRGALAAAREGDDVNPEKKSSCQQFYIVTGRTYGEKGLEQAQQMITEWTGGTVVLAEEMQEVYRNEGGAPHLDGSYTVFGRVIKGMEFVDSIQQVETDENNRPLNDIHIIRATVTQQ